MNASSISERCSRCDASTSVRPKLLLIDPDQRYDPESGEIIRFIADLRVYAVAPSHRREAPLEQFVNGFYCDACGLGFVSEQILSAECVGWGRKV